MDEARILKKRGEINIRKKRREGREKKVSQKERKTGWGKRKTI